MHYVLLKNNQVVCEWMAPKTEGYTSRHESTVGSGLNRQHVELAEAIGQATWHNHAFMRLETFGR